jgi:hypothetical protein
VHESSTHRELGISKTAVCICSNFAIVMTHHELFQNNRSFIFRICSRGIFACDIFYYFIFQFIF